MAVNTQSSGTITIRGKTYTLGTKSSGGTKFYPIKSITGRTDSEGTNPTAISLNTSAQYTVRYYATGDLVTHPYCVHDGSNVIGWYKSEIFPKGTYTITYNKGSYGTGSQVTATKTHGTNLTLKGAIFTRTGYTQTGWSLKKNGSTKKYNLSATYSTNDDETFYPYWTVNTYTISYDMNGGSGSIASQSYTYSTTASITLSKTIPTKANCTFLGWSTKKAATTATYAAGSSFKRNKIGNTKLYAVWTEKTAILNVRPVGGIWNDSEGYSAIEGNAGDQYDVYPPTREGYKFVGWFKKAKGSLSNEATTSSLFTSNTAGKNPVAYTNQTDGTVTFNIYGKTDSNVSAAGDPGGGFEKIIKIVTTGRTSKKGTGGFCFAQKPVAGVTYTHVMCVKAPVNTTISIAHNNITGVNAPTGQGVKWLTPNKGTGNWERYAYELTVPSAATTLGTFGHIYLTTTDTSNVTWYVAGNQITKSVNSKQSFTFSENGDSYIYAQWVPWGQVKFKTEEGWVETVPYIYQDGAWKPCEPYIYKNSTWKIGI